MQSTHRTGQRRSWRVAVAGTAGAALLGLAALQPASAQKPDAIAQAQTSGEQTASVMNTSLHKAQAPAFAGV